MNKIIIASLASLMALGLSTSSAAAVSIQDNPDLFVVIPKGECTPYMLLGWRGSGEPVWSIPKSGQTRTALQEVSDGIGETIGVVYQQLQANRYFAGKVSTAYSKMYNAEELPSVTGTKLEWDNYLFDVGRGNSVHFKATFMALAAKCPNSKFIVAGYSQGAAIPAYAFKNLTSDEQKKIIGIYLVGDPGRQRTGMLPELKAMCAASEIIKATFRQIIPGLVASACAKKPTHNALQVVSPTLKSGNNLTFFTYNHPDDLVAYFTKFAKNPLTYKTAKREHGSYKDGGREYRSLTDSFVKTMEIMEKYLTSIDSSKLLLPASPL